MYIQYAHVKSTHFFVFFRLRRVQKGVHKTFLYEVGKLGEEARGPFYYGNMQDSENAPEIDKLI
jgi:hypothetical protein